MERCPASRKPNGSSLVKSAGWVQHAESFLKLKFVLFLCAAFVPVTVAIANTQRGIASVYSTDSGTRTASGARLNPAALTAAHRFLPFGSKVRVTNRKNSRSVVVTINDRGPFVRGRIIDLTPAGARALGFSGLASVTVERETKEASSNTVKPQRSLEMHTAQRALRLRSGQGGSTSRNGSGWLTRDQDRAPSLNRHRGLGIQASALTFRPGTATRGDLFAHRMFSF
jgi:rare lipoprotein A